MTGGERRKEICRLLAETEAPVSASVLAERLGVSRQIIVSDIALLRAAGTEVDATPRGYRLQRQENAGWRGFAACRHHTLEEMRRELYDIVDNGGTAVDVRIENALYGELIGRLMLANRYDVDAFMKKAAESPDGLLSPMAGGVHLHQIACADGKVFRRICEALRRDGILIEENTAPARQE